MTSLPSHPLVPNTLITFPSRHVLLVTLNRPAALNALPSAQHGALAALWAWYDAQPQLRCAVLTGAEPAASGDGRRRPVAFCAGADLKEWDANNNSTTTTTTTTNPNSSNTATPSDAALYRERWTHDGFGGLSNRAGKKPVIAAVNGLCYGGGMEMAINCDLVVADGARARFGLPEVRRGVIAVAGALPRLVRTVGRQRAAEMALLGRVGYTAEEMREWGVVNFVVGEGQAVAEAVKVAEEIARNSPDAVIASREGLRLGWEGVGPQLGTELLEKGMYGRIDGGENMKEGVRSFVERREPVWKDSKL